MKIITIITAVVLALLPNLGRSEVTDVKLIVTNSAKGDVAEGFKALGKLSIPKGVKITPAPSKAKTEVEVSILRFDFENVHGDEFIASLDERIEPGTLLKLIDDAGFRPATVEEMLAVRPLLKLDYDVSVYGSKAFMKGQNYHFTFQYQYQIGEDIMQYINGAKVGLFPADWKWAKRAVAIAAVKK